MRYLAVLALLFGSVAQAGEQAQAEALSPDASAHAPVAPPQVEPPPSKESFFYEGTHFGMQFNAGAPGGAALSVVGRPWKFLRGDLGFAWNYLGFGVKGGVTLVPFQWAIVPTLGVEVGHFFDADASSLTTDATAKLLLKSVGYTYLTGDIGVEFGPQNRFIFFVRVGMTYLSAPVKGVVDAFQANNANVRSAGDATVSYFGPSAKLGFVIYVY